ncbi:MAG: alpha/beta hydrolase [Deltaproteobacteria bacterium]|nr:alpha/beta hydrolase [Deltaproteobacteria bacterium]
MKRPPCPVRASSPSWAAGSLPPLLLACLALPEASCRKTDRLPPREEERDEAEAGAERLPPSDAGGAEASEAPRRLSAFGRPTPEKLALTTSDGVALVGDYFPPPEPSGAPVVVLVHGEGGSRLDFQPLVDRILATPTARPAVVAIDLRGHGESVHAGRQTLAVRTLKPDPAAGVGSWQGLVEDVGAVLRWLRGRAEIGERAVIVGVDVGAVAAARAAAEVLGPPGRAVVVGLVALSPAELHGVAFGTRTFPALSSRGVQALAVAAEDGPAGPPQGVRALEAGLGTARAQAEVFATGGHGMELVERRPDVEARVLAFLRRMLGGTRDFALTLDDGAVLHGSIDASLDPGGPAVILVPDVGKDRSSLRRLRGVLAERLPYDVVVFDLRGYGESRLPEVDGGEDAGEVPFRDDVSEDDPWSWRVLVRDLEALSRIVAAGGDVAGTPEPLHFIRRSAYALVGMGMAGTVAAEAAGELVEDSGMPRLGALVLISPIANAHGMTIWSALGDHLLPRRVGVFAAAGSRALLTAADVDGMGSVAKTVRAIQAMFRDDAVTRIYTSDAHGEVLVNVHADLAPAIADFLFARLSDERSGALPGGEGADAGAGGGAGAGAGSATGSVPGAPAVVADGGR